MVILGIDPGLNATGYGCVETIGGKLRIVAAGDIRPPRQRALSERLAFIHEALTRLITHHRPGMAVLEQIFTHQRYLSTATLMAHARGVACLAVQQHGVSLAQYPPAQVKLALTGYGNASKDQVARMVSQWLRHHDPVWSTDATDALALAIVHAQATQRHALVGVGS